MALIKLSNIGITAISGKAAGSVFSRNRGGEYFKNFVMPTDTFSQPKQSVRAVFGAISSGWRSLTQGQRNSWIEAAPLYLRTNAFGDQKQLSPNALFVAQNQNLANAGLPMIDTIGAPEGTNGIVGVNTPLSIDIGAGQSMMFGFGLKFDNSTLATRHEYVLEATPAHNASVRNVQNHFRKLASTVSDITSLGMSVTQSNFVVGGGGAMLNRYVASFGTPNVGDVVSIRIKAVNPSTGEVSTYWQSSATVIST